MVEQGAVNAKVVGSSPTAGAIRLGAQQRGELNPLRKAASAVSKDDGGDYGYGYGYSNGTRDQRDAVYTCVNEAERGSGYDNARVRDITDVDRRNGVYRVRGVVDIGGAENDRGIRSFTCFARDGEIYNFELNAYRF